MTTHSYSVPSSYLPLPGSIMTYQLDLSGCWAKLARAKHHADQLRGDIAAAWKPYTDGLPVRREYDAEDQAVVCRIKEVPQVLEDWALILGDGLHNLRCVLDHLAWQLAIRFNDGREPTEKKARSVQFPVVESESDWEGHRHTQQMVAEDKAFLKRVQPFNPRGPSERNAFLDLAVFSNIDKHRLLHVVTGAAEQTTFQYLLSRYRYCQAGSRPMPDGSLVTVEINGALRVLKPDVEVLRAFVVPTGPHPDCDFKIQVTGKFILESPTALGMPSEYVWGPVEFLDATGAVFAQLLRHFEPAP